MIEALANAKVIIILQYIHGSNQLTCLTLTQCYMVNYISIKKYLQMTMLILYIHYISLNDWRCSSMHP